MPVDDDRSSGIIKIIFIHDTIFVETVVKKSCYSCGRVKCIQKKGIA